jgi:uncharacterized membrane protein
MSADVKGKPRSMAMRLVLTIVGALLMVGPPYTFEVLELSGRIQRTIVVAVELISLVVGLVLLYLAFKGQESAS